MLTEGILVVGYKKKSTNTDTWLVMALIKWVVCTDSDVKEFIHSFFVKEQNKTSKWCENQQRSTVDNYLMKGRVDQLFVRSDAWDVCFLTCVCCGGIGIKVITSVSYQTWLFSPQKAAGSSITAPDIAWE